MPGVLVFSKREGAGDCMNDVFVVDEEVVGGDAVHSTESVGCTEDGGAEVEVEKGLVVFVGVGREGVSRGDDMFVGVVFVEG